MSNPHDPEEKPAADAPDEGGVPNGGASDGSPAAAGGAPADPHATVKMSEKDVERIVAQSYPSDPDDPLVGTLLRNKWRVLARIGSGSFGTVYKVQDVNGQWIEALKILSDDRLRGPDAEAMRARFLREAQIMKRLGTRSAHIVGLSTYEDDLEAGLIYFLMEHIEGRVLSEVLLEEGPLDIERAIRIGLQTCDAMIAAHESEEPVVHRDLKLENIMMTKDRDGEESIKVLDFGIAKIAEREGDARLTSVGTLGTPGYAAPEQLRAGAVDGRTDLFAFGVILYSLVTGRNPWLGHLAYQPTNQMYELMAASDRAEVLPISEVGVDVPEGMVDIIMKLLQRDPEDRFQSARELREALFRLGGGAISGGRLYVTKEPTAPTGTPSELERRPGTPSEPERRLAAVWFADLVGYSTLSSQDEEAALALLDTFHKTARREVESGGGRIVQFIGDAAFAEFSSTQRAVKTAVDFLDAFARATADAVHPPQLRIGIHVGDVLMASDGDLFGDGVNVASRIQNDAEPGQILVSQDVWRQLKQRRDFGFISVGERSLKGIGAPVHLFAVVEAGEVGTTGELGIGTGDPTTGLPLYPGTKGARPGRSKAKAAAAAIVVLSSLGVGGYVAVRVFGGESTPESAPPVVDANAGDSELPVESAEVVTGIVGDPSGGDAEVAAEGPEDDPTGETAGPTTPEAIDPSLGPYQRELRRVSSARDEALRRPPHSDLRNRLDAAESLWSSAGRAAADGRYAAATVTLRDAQPIYEEISRDSDLMRQFDSRLSELEGFRRAAPDSELRRQADGLAREANVAVSRALYVDGLGRIGEALTLMRQAAEAPDESPEIVVAPPEPDFVPADVAADVLARLKAAMEAEDIGRVRAVFTGIPDAAQTERSFGFMSDLRVTYSVRSINVIEPGERFEITVGIQYEFAESDDPLSAGAQIYTVERSGSGWTIVAARDAGDDLAQGSRPRLGDPRETSSKGPQAVRKGSPTPASR